MFKLPHNCTHFTCQESNAQNSPSQASIVHELRNSRRLSWILKSQRNQRSSCQHLLDHRKSKRFPGKKQTNKQTTTIYFCFIDSVKDFDYVDHNKLSILNERQTTYLPPEKSQAGQEATVRSGHGTQTGSKLGKEQIKSVFCHPAYLTYMKSTSCEMLC